MNSTKALRYIASKDKRPVWLRAFHIWQHKPHEVAPLPATVSTCSSCKTTFQGNFCPRCGQAAAIARFSFKKALLLFLDVWGIGNRSMFRSIRDLMLRPGYMIRDYLSGMQSAYFPPFKMFFLLTAFSLLVNNGISLNLNGKEDDNMTETSWRTEEGMEERKPVINGEEIESPMYYAGKRFAKTMDMLREKNPAIFALLTLTMFTLPLYFFLRKSPTIPDMRYSEFIVALVYTANTFSIFSIVGNLLNSNLLKLVAMLMVFVALRQFSGYTKKRLLMYIVCTIFISVMVMGAIAAIAIYAAYLYYGSPELQH